MFLEISEIVVTELRKQYDQYAEDLLVRRGFLRLLEREHPRTTRKFEILRALPTQNLYQEIKRIEFTLPLPTAIDQAFSTIRDLAMEMHVWRDSLPIHIQNSERGRAIFAVSTTLKSLKRPVQPLGLYELNLTVLFYPDSKLRPKLCTKRERLREVETLLNLCSNAVAHATTYTSPEEADDLDRFRRELDATAAKVCEVEFPPATIWS